MVEVGLSNGSLSPICRRYRIISEFDLEAQDPSASMNDLKYMDAFDHDIHYQAQGRLREQSGPRVRKQLAADSQYIV